MNNQNRDIATVFNDVYSKSCPKILGEQHKFLLESLKKHLKNKNSTLAIFGPGGQVLPYSCKYNKDGSLGETNREYIKEIIGNGNIILIDYLTEFNKGGLEKGKYTLKKMGFFDKDYFKPSESEDLEERTIKFLKNNLRSPIKLDDNSIDAIDANLSIHHASVTRNELNRIYQEMYRILKPNGMLHLGEGNVNMNYSEDKLIKVGQDISKILNQPVLMSDERDKNNNFVTLAYFEKNTKYNELPVIEKGNNPQIVVDEDGLIKLKTKENITDKLKEMNYKQILSFSNEIIVPLIDPEIEEDYIGLIKPVNNFYNTIAKRVTEEYFENNPKLVKSLLKGSNIEREYAKRGIVEYYMSENIILKTLKKVGFKDIFVKYHKKKPFYNITAKK